MVMTPEQIIDLEPFKLEIESIDRQHNEVLSRLSSLLVAFVQGTVDEQNKALDVIKESFVLWMKHCSDEISLLHKTNWPNIDFHIKDHEKTFIVFSKLKSEPSIQLIGDVITSIVTHINTYDIKYVEHVKHAIDEGEVTI